MTNNVDVVWAAIGGVVAALILDALLLALLPHGKALLAAVVAVPAAGLIAFFVAMHQDPLTRAIVALIASGGYVFMRQGLRLPELLFGDATRGTTAAERPWSPLGNSRVMVGIIVSLAAVVAAAILFPDQRVPALIAATILGACAVILLLRRKR